MAVKIFVSNEPKKTGDTKERWFFKLVVGETSPITVYSDSSYANKSNARRAADRLVTRLIKELPVKGGVRRKKL